MLMNQGQAVSGPLEIPVGSFEAMNLMWLVVSTPLKNMKVSWDYYSQLNGKIKNVRNHQPV